MERSVLPPPSIPPLTGGGSDLGVGHTGGGILEKESQSKVSFPQPSSQDWVRTLGRDGGRGRGGLPAKEFSFLGIM